jgi:hypothetical protein
MNSPDSSNLNSALFVGQVDDSELSSILLRHFQYSYGQSDEVIFHRRSDLWAIKLIFAAAKIASAVAGPGLKPEDVSVLSDKIRGNLVEPSKLRAARCILFSSYRVTGKFSYGKKLSLFPLPDHAPKAPDLKEEERFSENPTIQHPFIAEFPIRESADQLIAILRLQGETRKYALLLNVFLEGGVSRPLREKRRRHWVHDGNRKSPSVYLQEDYRYPGFADMGPWFSRLDHIPLMETMRYPECFSSPRQEFNAPLRVPLLLATFLERFEGLCKPERERFLRAAFWLRHAEDVWLESTSAAYLAIINCIEVLLPPRNDRRKDRSAKSRTKQFIEFLNENAPAYSEDTAERQKIYKIRSDLTHGWDLFYSDMEAYVGINPRIGTESQSRFLAKHLACVALLNWLMRATGGWPHDPQPQRDSA